MLTAAIAIYLLARLSQVGWLYLVDSVLWGALLLALVMSQIGVVFIAARRTVSPANMQKAGGRIFEGDGIDITIALKNRLFFPRFFHSVIFDSHLAGPDGAAQKFFVALLPGSGTLPLKSTIEAYQRGLHNLGPVTLESSAPFGFFRRRRTLSGPHPLLVLPRVYPLSRLILVDGQDGKSARTRVLRNGMDVAGSRPYVQGDSRRMMHWRNTARAGRPMVKETEDQTDRALHIMFGSRDVFGDGRDTNLEYAIKFAAAVADYALKNGVPVQMWGSHLRGVNVAVAGSVGNPAGLNLTWFELLESLAVAGPTERQAMEEGLTRFPSGANLFVVVSPSDDGAKENLGRALGRSGESVVVRLEGFGEPAGVGGSANSLNLPGASVLTCRPGGLAQTLSEIEALGRPNSSRAPGIPAARVPAGAGRP